MGNTFSKFVKLSLHERVQWFRSLGSCSHEKKEKFSVGQVLFSRDPGPVPLSFAEALDMCIFPSPNFTPIQMRGLRDVFVAYVLMRSDSSFWMSLLELAWKMKGGTSVDLIVDRFVGLGWWITFEEKRNSQLTKLIHSAAARFSHEVNPQYVTIVAKALIHVSPSKTCAYQFCPSGCMLEHTYTCSGCGVVTYCSKKCQKDAWVTHRDICRLYQNYVRNDCVDEAE